MGNLRNTRGGAYCEGSLKWRTHSVHRNTGLQTDVMGAAVLLAAALACVATAATTGGVSCAKKENAVASTCEAFGTDSEACYAARRLHTASCKLPLSQTELGEGMPKASSNANTGKKTVDDAERGHEQVADSSIGPNRPKLNTTPRTGRLLLGAVKKAKVATKRVQVKAKALVPHKRRHRHVRPHKKATGRNFALGNSKGKCHNRALVDKCMRLAKGWTHAETCFNIPKNKQKSMYECQKAWEIAKLRKVRLFRRHLPNKGWNKHFEFSNSAWSAWTCTAMTCSALLHFTHGAVTHGQGQYFGKAPSPSAGAIDLIFMKKLIPVPAGHQKPSKYRVVKSCTLAHPNQDRWKIADMDNIGIRVEC